MIAPVLVAHGLLTHGTTKLPLPATKWTKNDTHAYPGVIMGGASLDPKHNVGKCTPTECVDHCHFTGSRHRWSSEASSYANQFDRHSIIGHNTYINSCIKRYLTRLFTDEK
ncbi:hypothetical protein PoB_005571000 [Plakobranchus ocellatus]|uniref:Uncharacterized protein n=1 Tax=Plakobranchus ocellatus TaxID=259542 RepID=A0AAV4CCR1_9GAST|nr:hypothetical protein PoB_005571000 [Plakobranchus ocellatus]